jgi:hypothetical protein
MNGYFLTSSITGLKRIRGKCGAVEVGDTLRTTLQSFGIDIDKDVFH